MIENKKMDKAINGLITRQNYLVTQANDLARAFGNLTSFEHKVLDFCFSFVKAEDTGKRMYTTKIIDILHHFGLNSSGQNYKRVIQAFKALNEGTAIYMRTVEPDGQRAILMTSLFDHIKLIEDGRIEFRFSEDVSPYIFQLKEHYYSFKLSELSRVKSKYTLTLMKLWNANSLGKLNNAVIEGQIDEWEDWFLGSNDLGKPKRYPAGRFKQRILNVATEELNKLYPNVNILLETHKEGVKVIGYRMEITKIKTNLY